MDRRREENKHQLWGGLSPEVGESRLNVRWWRLWKLPKITLILELPFLLENLVLLLCQRHKMLALFINDKLVPSRDSEQIIPLADRTPRWQCCRCQSIPVICMLFFRSDKISTSSFPLKQSDLTILFSTLIRIKTTHQNCAGFMWTHEASNVKTFH